MGEILAETLLFTILNFIGGAIRWFIALLWHTIFNTKKHPFKEYIYSSETDEFTHDGANSCLNILIGMAFVVFVVFIISKL